MALIIYIYQYSLCHQILRRMRAIGWLGLSCFSLQFVKTKGSSLSPSRNGMSFSHSATLYPPAITLHHLLAFQWKCLQLLMLASMLPPTPAPLPSIGRRPVRIQSYCSSNISVLQLEKYKRVLAGLQLQGDPSSAETSHTHKSQWSDPRLASFIQGQEESGHTVYKGK